MKVLKVKEKELKVKELLEELKTKLNIKSIKFNKNQEDWDYITSLGHSEMKLKELLELIDNPISN